MFFHKMNIAFFILAGQTLTQILDASGRRHKNSILMEYTTCSIGAYNTKMKQKLTWT